MFSLKKHKSIRVIDLPTNKSDIMRTDFRFSRDVLVGNWYEERFTDQRDKNAITPCIYGKSKCNDDVSTYCRNFQVNWNEKQRTKEYINLKAKAFETGRHVLGTQLLQQNSPAVESVYKLSYKAIPLPRRNCKPYQDRNKKKFKSKRFC